MDAVLRLEVISEWTIYNCCTNCNLLDDLLVLGHVFGFYMTFDRQNRLT